MAKPKNGDELAVKKTALAVKKTAARAALKRLMSRERFISLNNPWSQR